MDVDLTVVAGAGVGSDAETGPAPEIALDHGRALHLFATACAEEDDDALAAARVALVDETDAAFMVDAAAVAANFEMMTRLADGTGSRMPADRLERSAAAIGAMGVGELTSRR